MNVVAIFILAIGVMITIAIAQYMSKQRRRQDIAHTALVMGLSYSPSDDRDTCSLPFALFRKGDGRGAENVMWGTLEATPVRIADYWYYEESTDSKGNTSRSYHRFSCAIGLLPFDGAALAIAHETVFTRMGRHLGFDDIELESEEFNRVFRLHATDKKFAYAVCDTGMMAWLLDVARGYCFEIVGPFVMAYTHKLQPPEISALARALLGFRAHVPHVVTTLYPAAPEAMHL